MKHLNNYGFDCKKIICKDDNHFSLIDTLAKNDHILVKNMIKLSKKP